MAKFSVNKFNKAKLFNIDTTGFEYVNLETLYKKDGTNTTYVINGIYINNKSLYEPAPVAATNRFYINLPTYTTDVCREMLDDKATVSAINRGLVGIKIVPYESERYHKTCYGIEWCDVEPDNETEENEPITNDLD